MTTGQQSAVDQRLDQHADAMEIVLNLIDEIVSNDLIRTRRLELTDARLRKLESIVLPDDTLHN